MAIERTLVNAEALVRLPDDGQRHELVLGELRTMPPAGAEHGIIAGRVFGKLFAHVEPRGLGNLFAAETGFLITRQPDTVRAPDVAFVVTGRLAAVQRPSGFAALAPDLVVEVVSPSDTAAEVEEKVQAWLRADVRLVWVVHPATRSVTVYRSLTGVRVLTEADEIGGTPVLPEFRCSVGQFFPTLP
jgi:Uma2 family endonuclease